MNSSPSQRPSSWRTDPRQEGTARREASGRDAAGRDGTPWQPVRGGRVSEEVVAQIRQAFFDGLRPGDWLGTEAELAERFGVSRVTIRDAVRTLETRGIVDVRVGAGGGLRVADVDPDRFHEALAVQLHLMGVGFAELIDAQSAIEPFTAEWAARLRTGQQLEAIRATLQDQHTALDDPVQFTDAGNAFHVAVAEASGNRVLRAALEALSAIRLAAYSPRANPRRARRVLKVHEEILAAIAARDGELARRLMTDHVQHVRSQHGTDRHGQA